ncbi:MAG: hypothetical protein IJ642_04900 [Oscillospiraceae bacterium]|nr:hypothetical protein [Oscillospiraceae bacterium]
MGTEYTIKHNAFESAIEIAKARFSGISSEVTAETAKNEVEYIEAVYNKLQELYTDRESSKNH